MHARDAGPRLWTQRLQLRPPLATDAVHIAELANDAEIARMTSRVRYPYRLADAQAYLASQAGADPGRERTFLVEHPDFGPIGVVGVHVHEDLLPELGYWLGRTFRHRGLMTEAVLAGVAWACARQGEGGWGRRGLVSGHYEDNPASGRVLEKAGFLYTGEVRPRFSLGRGCEVATRMMVRLG